MSHNIDTDNAFLEIARQLEPNLNELYDGAREAERDVRVGWLAGLVVRGGHMSEELNRREKSNVAAHYGVDIETVDLLVLRKAIELFEQQNVENQYINLRRVKK